jgi:hypothetical protein
MAGSGLGNTLSAARYNGVNQQQYVLTDPDFFPTVPSPGALNTAQSQTIEKISSGLRAPCLMQTAVTVERQIGANTALAVTYTNAQGLRMLRSVDINAPLPGTYNSSVSGSGVPAAALTELPAAAQCPPLRCCCS